MKLWQKIFLISFGIFLTIVILEIGLRIGGLAILSMQEYRNQQSIKQKDSFRIMCLGESTTQGTYPPYLEEILNQSNVGIKFSVIDKGVSGIDTSAILSQLENNLNKYNPDMVIVMMGLNDRTTINYVQKNIFSKDKDIAKQHVISLIRPLRVYKLIDYIRLSLLARLREKRYFGIIKNRSSTKEVSNNLKTKLMGQKLSFDSSSGEYRIINKETGLLMREGMVSLLDQGRLYLHENEYKLAQECFKKVIAITPTNETAYIGLARSYCALDQLVQAREAAEKAIAINPQNNWTYFELGGYYQQDQPVKAEVYYKKAIELNFGNDWLYTNLAWLYRSQGKLSQTEVLLKQALTFYPNSYWINAALASLYRDMKKGHLVTTLEKKLEVLSNNIYSSSTVDNYHKLKEMLDKRNIKLVCVQYPVARLGPLRKIFDGPSEIIFVDNEKIFKDVLAEESYRDLFRDMYGGDFGHCTEKGNKLLAENIANTILKEAFNKK